MEKQPTPINAIDDWHVSTRLVSADNGAANIEVSLFNSGYGALPPFTIRVDWKQGQEAGDTAALALQLLAQSLGHLRIRALEQAFRLSNG
jgi:hypothetical protein